MVDGIKITGGAGLALAFGKGALAPGFSYAAKGSFPESRCGVEKEDNKKILVAYASRYGSTGGVAEGIGRFFCERGETADIRLIKNIGDLDSYNAVIIGSAVRSSRWLPEAVQFVQDNRKTLSRMPVAYFLTCLALSKQNPGTLRTARSYMDSILKEVPEVKPVDRGLFPGVLNYGKMSFIIRMVMKSKMKDRGISEGDYRDWNMIRSWAENAAPKLLPSRAALTDPVRPKSMG